MGIRKKELSPTTTVPHLFFPNASMVSPGDKTQVNLVWNSKSVDQKKNCRHHGRPARVCTSFSFLFSGRSFLCLPPVGAYIDTTTPLVINNTNACGEKAPVGCRKQKQATLAESELMACCGCFQVPNYQKDSPLPSEPAFLPPLGFTDFQK